jgi:hypothetical protein
MRIMSSVGALANAYSVQALEQRLQQAQRIAFYPLGQRCWATMGVQYTQLAINEVVFSRQVCKLQIQVAIDGREQPVIGDGVIVSTPIWVAATFVPPVVPTFLPYDAATLALNAIALHKRSEWSNVLATTDALIEIEAYLAVRPRGKCDRWCYRNGRPANSRASPCRAESCVDGNFAIIDDEMREADRAENSMRVGKAGRDVQYFTAQVDYVPLLDSQWRTAFSGHAS